VRLNYQKMDETQHARFADLENVSSNEIGPRQRVVG
jgi:hypothetical protein